MLEGESMKALEILSREVVPLGCLVAAVFLVVHGYPAFGGAFAGGALFTWFITWFIGNL
jgi:hypothetical protein